jgi:hypothetical protein
MLKKIVWKADRVLSVKLRDQLFTLAQMRAGSCMEFFDIASEDGKWKGVDLTDVPLLFCIKVAENRLKKLFVDEVDEKLAKPNRRPMPAKMIDFQLSGDGNHGGDLIELSAENRYSNIGARVVKAGLTVKNDLQIIYTHELVGMVGDPEKLRKRLTRYFDTGVNWDEAKSFIFKGIQPPPPSPRK